MWGETEAHRGNSHRLREDMQTAQRQPQPAGVCTAVKMHFSLAEMHFLCQGFSSVCSQLLLETQTTFLQEGFVFLLLECPAAGGIHQGVWTWWLRSWTWPSPLISGLLDFLEMMDLLSLVGEWKWRRSTVPTFIWLDEQDTVTKLQLTPALNAKYSHYDIEIK